MPYIPEKHKKYNLLPFCRKNGYEVFEYPSELLFEIGDINIKLCQTITPYGYKSYKEYYSTLDWLIKRNRRNKKLSRLLRLFKKEMIRLNNKDLWSVLKYTGETNEFHLTHGRAYYWPCTKENPYFCGIVMMRNLRITYMMYMVLAAVIGLYWMTLQEWRIALLTITD